MAFGGNEVEIIVTSKDQTKAGFDSATKQSSTFGDKIASIGKVAAAGFVAAGVAAVAFGKEAISEASDLNETINKTKVIFGSNAKSVLNWSKSSATAFGLSRNDALAYASDLGNMFDQLGFGAGQTERLSKSTVKFAADLGSFHNLGTGDVLERINAAMRGEYDSLQQLIPNINAARVEQVAMARTGKTSADALTQQEKAAAALAIIHKDGAKAAGDFQKTSGSLANQQKILSAQMDNFQAKVGKLLLPVMVKLMGFITGTVMPGLTRFSQWFSTKAVPAIQEFAGAVRDKLQPVIDWIRDHWPEISATIGRVFDRIVDDVRAFIRIVVKAWNKWGDDILRVARVIFDYVRNTIRNNLQIIRGVIKVITGIIRGDWSRVWSGIKDIFGGVWNQIKNIVQTAMRLVREVIRSGWDAVKDVFKAAGSKIRDGLKATFDGLKNLVVGYFSWWIGKTRDALSIYVGIWRNVLGTVADIFGNLWDKARTIFANIADRVRGAFDRIRGVIDAVTGAVRDLISAINSIPKPDLPDLPSFSFPGMAHGGISGAAAGGPRGRLTLVGERGPELVNLAPGSHVHPAGTTQRMLTGMGAGVTVNLEFVGNDSDVSRFLVAMFRKYVRVQGGNVQQVFGS